MDLFYLLLFFSSHSFCLFCFQKIVSLFKVRPSLAFFKIDAHSCYIRDNVKNDNSRDASKNINDPLFLFLSFFLLYL